MFIVNSQLLPPIFQLPIKFIIVNFGLSVFCYVIIKFFRKMAFYTFRPASVLILYVNNPIAIFPFYLLIQECQDNFRLKTFLQQHLSSDNLTIFLLKQLKIQVMNFLHKKFFYNFSVLDPCLCRFMSQCYDRFSKHSISQKFQFFSLQSQL